MNTSYSSNFQVWILCKVAGEEITIDVEEKKYLISVPLYTLLPTIHLAVIVCVMIKMSEGFVFTHLMKFLLQKGLLG